MKKVMVVAPHPDDETLGCGGALLKHEDNGDKIYYLLITSMNRSGGWSAKQINKRDIEIKKVEKLFGFKKSFSLGFNTSKLDMIPMADIISSMREVINKIKPEVIYVPCGNDAHTDHQIVSKATSAFSKWFRYPFIKEILEYETISETDFNFVSEQSFKPNMYIDISKFFLKKLKIMKLYQSELQKPGNPRSIESIEALAKLRGSQSGFKFAESFRIILQRK
tara:strand:+ start:1097 stop:1762 length:666 start_codon:yes stop_codon:yes gene_type:complete